MSLIIVAGLLAAVTTVTIPVAAGTQAQQSDGDRHQRSQPLVIGHRGASGYRPEHTLASYELAARMGADYIEPDLVSTKDHVLIVRHENYINETTDVADHPEFANRKTTKIIDGTSFTGWFTEDFTLAEIKTLRARERLPLIRQHNTLYDGLFQVPTFAEVLALRKQLSRELHRTIGIYPETKHPTYFAKLGLELETPLVQALKRANLTSSSSPVFIQSFELTNLIKLRKELRVRNKLVFLTSATGSPFGDEHTYAYYTSPQGLAEVAKTVNGIGPDKAQIIPRNTAGNLGTPTALVSNAHAAGLLVHPYTFRAENDFLPTNLKRGTNPAAYGSVIDEMTTFLNTGIDGFFTDQADIGILARDRFVSAR
ncbi:MAG: glycerophosphodiester phosphodiesterase [Nakamurella sp.]